MKFTKIILWSYNMPISHAFPKEELENRLGLVRKEMKKNNLNAILISAPENIYYLTGENAELKQPGFL